MDDLFSPLHLAERDWNLPPNLSYHSLSWKGQIQMVNIVSPASHLDAERTFSSEVLKQIRQTSIKKMIS